MLKRKIFIIFFTFLVQSFGQINPDVLEKKAELKVKDCLELKLQILSNSLSSGSYIIPDLGSFNYPVKIFLNRKNSIEFEVFVRGDSKTSIDNKKDIIQESWEFLKYCLIDNFKNNFLGINLNIEKCVIGKWYDNNGPFILGEYKDGVLKF